MNALTRMDNMNNKMWNTVKVLLPVVALAICLIPGRASDISDTTIGLETNARGEGMGGAVSPVCFDAGASLFNPATLAMINKWDTLFVVGSQPAIDVVYRGSLTTPSRSAKIGQMGLNFAGFALPLGGNGGTLGVSYARIGNFSQNETGFVYNQTSGQDTIEGRQKIVTDLITVAYGFKLAAMGKLNVGVGAVVAQQKINDEYLYTLSEGTPGEEHNFDGSGNGVGFIVGVHYPGSILSWGASYRSEVSLSGLGDLKTTHSEAVPSRINAGAACLIRRSGDPTAGAGSDLIGVFEYEILSGVNKNLIWERDETTNLKFGLELAMYRPNMILPVRVGYKRNGSGIEDFTDNELFTVGVGYRPINEQFSLDLAVGFGSSVSTQTTFGLSYRFDN